jgi:hypothetical protein
MNQHLAKAIALYEENDIDFQQLLTWHLCHGIVVCDHDSFSMCYFSDSESPETPCLFEHSDTLFVTICTGNMGKALRKFVDDFQYISFQRDFKNSHRLRCYDMHEFYNKLK